MPEMIDATFPRTPADVIACPDPACGAAATIVDRRTSGRTAPRRAHQDRLRAHGSSGSRGYPQPRRSSSVNGGCPRRSSRRLRAISQPTRPTPC